MEFPLTHCRGMLWKRVNFFRLLLIALLGWGGINGRALQFDLFTGYDGMVREANWFPVSCEIFNPGPTFDGVIEITSGSFGSDQVRRIPMELPTNTRKRFIIPVFSPGGRFLQWNARLVDERGKVRAELPNLQPSVVTWDGILIGALSRSFPGAPVLPDIKLARAELTPRVARILTEHFPDNPLLLEALDAVYLNSEKALELRPEQIEALLGWVRNGGHLIVAIEQVIDLSSLPWLQMLLPMRLEETQTMELRGAALYQWLRQRGEPHLHQAGYRRSRSIRVTGPPTDRANSPPIAGAFGAGQFLAATGIMRDGEVLFEEDGIPLVVAAPRGRGQVTLLTFSPEREPFRSWNDRQWFWSRVFNVNQQWYAAGPNQPVIGGSSIDGIFGGLLDSRQVRKPPLELLLALLVAYLLVIGPLDQYWLKKINRQMLTWVTFPAYVLLFSLLIYYIGKTLRKGETEWNELQVVDVLPAPGGGSDFRGSTWISVYASENSRFPLRSQKSKAVFRGEVLDLFGGGRETSRGWVEQYGNTFRAEIAVPVWTTQLYVHEWVESGNPPVQFRVRQKDELWEMQVANLLPRPIPQARIVFQGALFELGTLAEKSNITFQVERLADPQPRAGPRNIHGQAAPLLLRQNDGKEIRGMPLSQRVGSEAGRYQQVVQSRRQAVGDATRGWLENPEVHSMMVSFLSNLPTEQQHHRGFFAPASFDLTHLVDRGYAILLAWDPGNGSSRPLSGVRIARSSQNTLYRLAVPVEPETSAPGRRASTQ
jgi:hypothetical protein